MVAHAGTMQRQEADEDDLLVLDKAAEFGWSLDQLDSPALREWLCE